jgi:8-oxo-dGTP pyrophosphatase MutT (NUDIX family)
MGLGNPGVPPPGLLFFRRMPETAARRELAEEIGLRPSVPLPGALHAAFAFGVLEPALHSKIQE